MIMNRTIELNYKNNLIEGFQSGDDVIVDCDAEPLAFTVVMPDAKMVGETKFWVKKKDSVANDVTINFYLGQHASNSTELTLANQGDLYGFLSDNENYVIISKVT